MRILLINPPHTAIGSRIPKEQLPPFGLLSVGGPLIDAGHDVELFDAEFGPKPVETILKETIRRRPDLVMMGHSGSTSADPTVRRIATLIRKQLPKTKIVYGGVFPTYHWADILRECRAVDVIVRGEGEDTIVKLVDALESGAPLEDVRGIAFRRNGVPHATPPAQTIACLDDYRIGWELIDFARYSYWGGKRAVVMQFSRGCPHLCNYCGQRGFWTRWRHRDPKKLAAELARLHREHGVELVNFADENPTSSKRRWREFLEAMIAEKVPLIIIGSTRADDIVRDADILPLYKKAGVLRFLMGMENTDETTLAAIRKGGSTTKDREAIRLLRQHGIISLATWVVGFEEETDLDYWRTYRQLLSYDPDQIMSVYVTPHRWTPYFRIAQDRKIIQTDQRKWDYKHQVLKTKAMPPWRIHLWVKLVEVALQIRPRALWRNLFHPDREVRHGMRWYTRMGRRVWIHEVLNFFFRDRRLKNGPTVREFWGEPQDAEEQSMVIEIEPPKPVIESPARV